MKVSVVVPVYNEEQYIKACLESLLDQEVPADEIIVVNNNSTDRTEEIATSFSIKLIQEKKQGMIPARNAGFTAAKYEIIARTDADTRVPRDWIKNIKTHFAADNSLIALSGPAHFYELPDVIQISNWPTRIFSKTMKQTLKHDFLFGPNMALRKTAWDKIKNSVCKNDKDVHEDIDLAIHLAPFGKILFDTSHVVSSSFRRWKRMTPYFEYPYRYIKTVRKHKTFVLEQRGKHLMKKMLTVRLLKSKKLQLRIAVLKNKTKKLLPYLKNSHKVL